MPRAHPAPTVASSLAAGRSAHLPSPLQSSGSPSRSQLRTWRPPVERTCPPQTLSTLDTEDHRSMPVPSSTSLLWMLNQLRLSQSPHNRFIDHKTCSSRESETRPRWKGGWTLRICGVEGIGGRAFKIVAHRRATRHAFGPIHFGHEGNRRRPQMPYSLRVHRGHAMGQDRSPVAKDVEPGEGVPVACGGSSPPVSNSARTENGSPSFPADEQRTARWGTRALGLHHPISVKEKSLPL